MHKIIRQVLSKEKGYDTFIYGELVTLPATLLVAIPGSLPNIHKMQKNEIKECVNKSEHVGKWFAVVGSTETIYISLGVRP